MFSLFDGAHVCNIIQFLVFYASEIGESQLELSF